MTDAVATLKSLEERLRKPCCESCCTNPCPLHKEAAAVIGALCEAMSEPSDEAKTVASRAYWNAVDENDRLPEDDPHRVSPLFCALKAAYAVQLEKIAKTAAKEAT